MPKTDITDERSLSRLQGIDLREHADQNVALDCVNLRLDNASRLTNYPRPTKVKAGSFSFACESKNPSLQEFWFSLDGYLGSPTIGTQVSYSGGVQTKLTGTNLGAVNKILLVKEDGTTIQSGQDFSYDFSGTELILDVYWSEYANYEKVYLFSPYGVLSFNVDVTVRENNVLYFGTSDNKAFKMGIDTNTLEFCIWKHSQTNGWEKIQSWKNTSAETWVESADLKVNVEFFAIQDEYGAFAFMPSFYQTTNQPLWLVYKSGDSFGDWLSFAASGTQIQEFGNATTGYTPDWYSPFAAYEGRYNFGKYDSYRLVINNGILSLQQRDTLEGDTYTTLQEWTYEA